jgi:hypothetical protein
MVEFEKCVRSAQHAKRLHLFFNIRNSRVAPLYPAILPAPGFGIELLKLKAPIKRAEFYAYARNA